MANKKPVKPVTRLKLAETRAARALQLGGKYLEIEAEDGTVVEVPRQSFWDAEEFLAWKDSDTTDDMALLERVLSPEAFAKIQAMKLDLGDLRVIVKELQREGDTDPE